LWAGETQAQKFLEYRKNRRYEKIRFYQGDRIKLKLKDGSRVEGEISQIYTNYFVIREILIDPDHVKCIYLIEKYSLWSTTSSFLMTGGLAYLPLVSFNRSINDDQPRIEESALVISGGMILGSFIAKFLSKKRYKVSSKKPLKIIDFNP